MADKRQDEQDKIRCILEKQTSRGFVTDFKQRKLEQEAAQNWDKFYKRNETRFFKDRHWTLREFGDVLPRLEDGCRMQLFEVGCGVGNFLYPLLEERPHDLFVHACDFSPRAVQFVKTHPGYDECKVHVFVLDITKQPAADFISRPPTVNVASLIFVLSAIQPSQHVTALNNVCSCLCDGAVLLFRDYARHDMAQLRFGPGSIITDNFYVKQDGTRVYYFSVEDVSEICSRVAGLTLVSCSYVTRHTVNIKHAVDIDRRFVQAHCTFSRH